MSELSINKPSLMSDYPVHRVCAIINNHQDATHCVAELDRNGIDEKNTELLFGEEGLHLFDPEIAHPNFISRIAMMLHARGEMEQRTLHKYEDALKAGCFVCIVPAKTVNQKDQIKNILSNHNATEINYFSAWVVESL